MADFKSLPIGLRGPDLRFDSDLNWFNELQSSLFRGLACLPSLGNLRADSSGGLVASSKRDFERFVAWLHSPDSRATPDVRRMANLVLANFTELAGTSRQHNQRSIHIVRHARMSLAQTTGALPEIQPTAGDGTWQWQSLRNFTLGPFRGFRTSETFDLRKRITLLYGPNGSGKSSFCEGLEYAMLGAVEEADTRRIDARTYLANVHAGRFEPPVLLATDLQGREVPVAANSDSYRFCFIEKKSNRRIFENCSSAHRTARRTDCDPIRHGEFQRLCRSLQRDNRPAARVSRD